MTPHAKHALISLNAGYSPSIVLLSETKEKRQGLAKNIFSQAINQLANPLLVSPCKTM